jgi:putative membrane protein
MSRLSALLTLATLAGLALALWVLGRVGLGEVAGAVTRIGVGGFLLFVAAHGVVLWMLGLAWAWSAPERLSPVRLFAWGRTVREAANELLPFSQLGGLVVGLRLVLAAGLPPVPVYAATVVDSVTEIASQILYVLIGLLVAGLLLTHAAPAGVTAAAWAGLGVLAVLTGGFVLLQRPLLALAGRAAGRFVPSAGETIAGVQVELARFGARPAALLPSFFANLAAWIASAATSWLALRLLGAPTPILWVVMLEALISVVRSGAFLIPGAIGAQEAGYLALAPLVGLPAEATLALSLLKRARDLAIGVPALLIWQAAEARRRRC